MSRHNSTAPGESDVTGGHAPDSTGDNMAVSGMSDENSQAIHRATSVSPDNAVAAMHGPGPGGSPLLRRRTLGARAFARAYLVVLLIPILLVIFSTQAPNTFATLDTMRTLLTTNAVLLILVVGQTLVLAVGELDFSFAGLVGMSGSILVAFKGMPLWEALVISLAAALLIGAINAFFVIILGVNSLIATLGMSTATTGIALAATNSATVPNPYDGFGNAVSYTIGGVGLPFFVALALLLVLWGVLERTKWGRNAYFVGAGRRAAAYAGIQVNRTRLIVFLVSALTSWLAGVVLVGQSGSGVAGFGSGYLLTVIAAVFLGYSAIKPGRYNAIGSLAGMFVLAIGTTGIEVLAAPIWLTDVFSGSILFVAVALANIFGNTRGLRSLRSALE